MTAAESGPWLVNSETVRLRLPEVEGDWNFVRANYMRSYKYGGLNILKRRKEELLHGIPKILNKYIPEDERGEAFYRGRKAMIDFVVRTTCPVKACQVDPDEFYAQALKKRDKLLDESEVWLACSPADPWLIMAFAIVVRVPSGLVLHYLFVKDDFRVTGMGMALLEAMAGRSKTIVATHMTRDWCKWAPRLVARGYKIEFNPYLIGESA